MIAYTIEINDQDITYIGDQVAIDFYKLISDRHLQLDNINASITGVDSPYLNVVIDTIGKTKQLEEDTVDKVVAFFTSNHVPWVWIIPSYMPNSYLLEHGFTVDADFPCMYYDLHNELPSLYNKRLLIQEVNQSNDLSEWIIPVNESFVDSEQQNTKTDDLYQKINANLLSSGKLRQFVAYYDNQLAGSSTLFISDNAVALHNIAVRPHLRKRGIGKVLTLHMMHLAKSLGFKHCFLDSSEDGYRLYKQLGFKNYSIKSAYIYTSRQ